MNSGANKAAYYNELDKILHLSDFDFAEVYERILAKNRLFDFV